MGKLDETWQTCLVCKEHKKIKTIPGMLHKTVVCDKCKEKVNTEGSKR